MSSSSSDASLGANIPLSFAKDFIRTPEKFDTVPDVPDLTVAAVPPVAQQPLGKEESFGIQIEDDLTIVHEEGPPADSALADEIKAAADAEAAEAPEVPESKAEVSEELPAAKKPSTKGSGALAYNKASSGKAGIANDKTVEFTETPFMPKMANETLKAQLGNAAWKLFHTILARYPDKPSKQEKSTLAQYIQLFAQVYPCGDCARHFQKLLKKYPPQIGSRKTAALWGCDIHNKVNDRLKKPIYDCTTILEDYDCGCGDDEKEADSTLGAGKSMDKIRKTGDSKSESLKHLKDIKIDEKEEKLQLGG